MGSDYIDPYMDRTESGALLLSWFLDDGIIRGIDKDGQLYDHDCDLKLTRRFIDGIKTLSIKGNR